MTEEKQIVPLIVIQCDFFSFVVIVLPLVVICVTTRYQIYRNNRGINIMKQNNETTFYYRFDWAQVKWDLISSKIIFVY